jgi:predicted nucleic acid-binding protein
MRAAQSKRSTIHAAVGMRSGLLRARHYHRRDWAVSLADCVAAETARARGAPVATADPHLLDMCRDEDIAVLALPDSTGHTWQP